ncbi:peptidylprolyl isomerase [Gloeocapsa sp. PCC 73106]|uniref:peptidylprolyl isomerase n=1 Tax=Gloeocapsa sp. PCC 73106 TaxID=102232 RepID=UPI0002AC8D91|nr:peptidylprolyl isomerase [Gloeocapsa sp. PCC 73106]ELR96749.1 peptidyl-prolyl cis-trans isomerase (rotamase) - cyclophilin family [Gloeocapsa sp. PCC 73106]
MTIALQGTATITMLINGEPVVVEVDGDNAPITAGNFVDLVDRGVYENTRFHRVVTEPEPFVVQGGDPQSQDPDFPFQNLGTGGFVDPDTGERRNIPLEIKPSGADEPLYSQTLPEGVTPELTHEQGVIAMARATEPDTASTQFYFALQELSFLNGQFAVFGRVLEGFDVIEEIQAIAPDEPGLDQSGFLERAALLSEVEVIDIGRMVITGTTEDDTLRGTSFNDRLKGLRGDDLLTGGRGRDRLSGGGGNDTLTGGGGNDFLDGGRGRNELDGGNGRDSLVGGMNDNQLTGGGGSDSFVFNRFDELFIDDDTVADVRPDSILDFTPEDDFIVLSLTDIHNDLSVGELPEELFALGSAPTNSQQRIIYDPNEGILSYDPDGDGDGLSVQLALLVGTPEINAAHILVS